MSVFFVTGKLGGGKSLMSVGKIKEYLFRGCPVATNLDIFLTPMLGKENSTARTIRIPDVPEIEHFELLGKAHDTHDDKKNGLIVLDECGTWFNSRSWADKKRQKIINWLLHSRKYKWDIIFIIQDLSVIDKQARVTMAEFVVYCRRTDRMSIPVISSILKFFWGENVPLPQYHIGAVKYGSERNAITSDTWITNGKSNWQSYDTNQVITPYYDKSIHSLLPPSYCQKYKRTIRNRRFFMRMTKVYFKRAKIPLIFLAGFANCFLFLFVIMYFSTSKAVANLPADVPAKIKKEKKSITASVAGLMTSNKNKNEKGPNDVVSKPPETKRIRVSHFINMYNDRKPVTKLLYNGVYELKNFPYPLVFEKGVFYAQIPKNEVQL